MTYEYKMSTTQTFWGCLENTIKCILQKGMDLGVLFSVPAGCPVGSIVVTIPFSLLFFSCAWIYPATSTRPFDSGCN